MYTRPAAALHPEERIVCHKSRPVNIQLNKINYSGRSGQHALLMFKSDSRASHYRNDMKVVNSKNGLHGHLFLIYHHITPKKHHEVVQDYSTTLNLPSICNQWWGEWDGVFAQKLLFSAVGKFQQAQHSYIRLLSTLYTLRRRQRP